MSKTEGIDFTMQSFRVVEGSLCEDGGIHFDCPFCSSKDSSVPGDQTEYFSVNCLETQDVFLVHSPFEEEEKNDV